MWDIGEKGRWNCTSFKSKNGKIHEPFYDSVASSSVSNCQKRATTTASSWWSTACRFWSRCASICSWSVATLKWTSLHLNAWPVNFRLKVAIQIMTRIRNGERFTTCHFRNRCTCICSWRIATLKWALSHLNVRRAHFRFKVATIVIMRTKNGKRKRMSSKRSWRVATLKWTSLHLNVQPAHFPLKVVIRVITRTKNSKRKRMTSKRNTLKER